MGSFTYLWDIPWDYPVIRSPLTRSLPVRDIQVSAIHPIFCWHHFFAPLLRVAPPKPELPNLRLQSRFFENSPLSFVECFVAGNTCCYLLFFIEKYLQGGLKNQLINRVIVIAPINGHSKMGVVSLGLFHPEISEVTWAPTTGRSSPCGKGIR